MNPMMVIMMTPTLCSLVLVLPLNGPADRITGVNCSPGDPGSGVPNCTLIFQIGL